LVRHFPATLAAAPFAPRLRRLEIAGRRPDPPSWAVLWKAKTLGGLRQFGFRTSHRLTQSISLEDLLAAPWLAGLEWLELAGHDETNSSAPLPAYPLLSHALQAAPLRALAIEGCALPDSEAGALTLRPPLPLEHLDLGSASGISQKVLRAVLQCPALSGL